MTVNTDIPADLPLVYADQRRMRQVILNLWRTHSNTPKTVERFPWPGASHQPMGSGQRQ